MNSAKRTVLICVGAFIGTAVCEERAAAQGTTTTPAGRYIDPDYILTPKGAYTVAAGQMAVSVEYQYGLVLNGVDQAGGAIGVVAVGNPNGGNWQGINVVVEANKTYWVKSRLNYTVKGAAKPPTAWVRGQATTPP